MSDTSLFTLSKSWHESTWLFEQLAFAGAGDAILLIQESVLALQSPITLASFIAKCKASEVTVYALRDDCLVRGVVCQYPDIQLVGYDGFVKLVVQHGKQVSW